MKLNSNKFYPQTLVFYIACLSGMIIFAGVTFFLNRQNGALVEESSDIWLGIAASMGLVGILSSDFLYTWFTNRLSPLSSWALRTRHLRIALIIRFVLLEITAMVAGVAFLISGSNTALSIMLLIIIYTAYRRPTREQLLKHLHASREEAEKV